MPSAFSRLQYLPCTPVVAGGRLYVAPGRVIAVTFNGIFLRRGLAAGESFSETAGIITLTFTPPSGEKIYALCVA